jgi:hypothetical protein
MQENCSTYKIPSFARAEAYNFAEDDFRTVFLELNQISEEITKCRDQKLLQNY